MKNAVFWDVKPCGYYKNRRFGGTYHFHHQGYKNSILRSVLRLLVTDNVLPNSLILVTLMMHAICSSETTKYSFAAYFGC
jgi:hypothetical protein